MALLSPGLDRVTYLCQSSAKGRNIRGRPRVQGNEGGRSSKCEKRYDVTWIIPDAPVSVQARFDSPLSDNTENKSQLCGSTQQTRAHRSLHACTTNPTRRPGDVQVHSQTLPAAPADRTTSVPYTKRCSRTPQDVFCTEGTNKAL